MVTFLKTNSLINTCQYGFRQGRCCVTNLLDIYHYVIRECDCSGAVDVVFLDFRKAFDKVTTNGYGGRFVPLSSKAMLLPRLKTDRQ